MATCGETVRRRWAELHPLTRKIGNGNVSLVRPCPAGFHGKAASLALCAKLASGVPRPCGVVASGEEIGGEEEEEADDSARSRTPA